MMVSADGAGNNGASSFSYTVPKQLDNIITETETFNSPDLKESAGRLDEAFSKFASILMEANDLVNARVNASCDECVFGAYGNQLLEMWNSNVPTFSEFKANFEAWSRAVSVIATRDENTEAIATAIYNNRATGADLTTATGQSVSEMREDIILSAADVDSGNNTGGGKTYRYYDENGVLTFRYENEEGEVYMQHSSDNNGNLTSTKCYDANGNYSEITFKYDENGKKIASETEVKFFDRDGNPLENAPDSFNDTGYLKDAKAGNDGQNPDGTPIGSEDNTGNDGGWSSYKDAAADGASSILTETEFARRINEDGYTCTDANGNTVTVKNYQEYLDVMYEKYGTGSVEGSTVGATETGDVITGEVASGDNVDTSLTTNSSDEYFIQRGDECTVYGDKVTFFARDGSYNYYTDANGNILIDADGGLRSLGCNEATFTTGYLKDPTEFYGAVTTTQSGASSMSLPAEVTNSDISYDSLAMDEYVDPSTISLEETRTYTTNEGFREDLLSGENLPKVIEFDHKLESSSWDIIQPDINPASNGKVTLVYDERAGMYYKVDDSGTYVRDMYGYTPEELAKFDIEN